MAFHVPNAAGAGVTSVTGTAPIASSGGATPAISLNNGGVTYAKMQNVSATDKVLGRSSLGAGDVEEIACTAAGRALIDDANNSDQRTTLGLGTMATATATDYVAKALFDAQTVLAATSDNTPAALTVGEQTVVGRATGGNVAALVIDSDLSAVSANDDTIPSAKATKAYADGKVADAINDGTSTIAPSQNAVFDALALKLALAGGTLTGEVNLGENAGLVLDAALSATGKYSGIVEDGTAGATLAFGDLVYLAVADSRWELTDADAEATAGPVKIGICVLAAGADGNATKVLLYGKVRADAKFPALTVGAPAYVSTTAGEVQTAQPSGADDVIRIVGYGDTADSLFFCPSSDYITHV